jgi:transposase
MKELVRKAYYRGGKSERQIARDLGIHRKTVKQLLKEDGGTPPSFQRKNWVSPVMGPYLPIIEAWLKEDESSPRKQQHTSKRIYERLVEEHQFSGSYRRVAKVVAKLRQKPKEVFLPLAFEPGEMAQVDWIEDLRVVIAGKLCKVQVLNLVLNYSGSVYCEAFEHARQEAFFQGQRNALSSGVGFLRQSHMTI